MTEDGDRFNRAEAEARLDERWGEFQDRYQELLMDHMPVGLGFTPIPEVATDGSVTMHFGPDFYEWMHERNSLLARLAIDCLLDTVYGPQSELSSVIPPRPE